MNKNNINPIKTEKDIENDAKAILSSFGYHEGDVVDYDNALDMLISVLSV